MLSGLRDAATAKRLFRKALTDPSHPQPRVINTDQARLYGSAIAGVKKEGLLKSRYDDELKRKEQLTAALTLPVSAWFALGTVMVAMVRSFSYMDGFLTCWFLIFLGLAAVAFLICVVYLGRAYFEPYMYLPHLGDLHKTRCNVTRPGPVKQ